MSDKIIIDYITNQLKEKTFTFKEIYNIYSFLKVFPNLIDNTIINILLRILKEQYPNSKLKIKIQKLYFNNFHQKGSGIFGTLGNIALNLGNTALSGVKLIGNTELNRVKSISNLVENHVNCNSPGLLECLSVSVPESAPLLAACAASGVETVGVGCIPALTELGGAAGICMAKNCKPKLF